MNHIIENDQLSATISTHGAELQSLVNKEEDIEYIWQADPQHWGRHAPVLFPIVGRIKQNTYQYNGQSYQLSQHGFARDEEFHLSGKSDTQVSFELRPQGDIPEIYPFDFILKITYTLEGNELAIACDVINPSADEMYFSIGGHPAFNCPVYADELRSDYKLKFEKKENAARHFLDGGLFTGETALVLDNSDLLPITDDLFDDDALVFKGLNSEEITLLDKDDEAVLTFQFHGFPYLGIWSKSATAPFICLEPWYGIADRQEHNQDYTQKEGIQHLEPQQAFEAVYRIIIH